MKHITEVLTEANKAKFLNGENYEITIGIYPNEYDFTMPSKKHLQKAKDFLTESIKVQRERCKQYGARKKDERSFAAVATAFNAITGNTLQGSDICLILQILKDVRQYSNPAQLHTDSLLDKVSYASLHAEELNKELT